MKVYVVETFGWANNDQAPEAWFCDRQGIFSSFDGAQKFIDDTIEKDFAKHILITNWQYHEETDVWYRETQDFTMGWSIEEAEVIA